MPDFGGGKIKEYSFSKAWGVNPSAASGTVLLDYGGQGGTPFGFEVGDYVLYSFDSESFSGIITETAEPCSFGSGRELRFSIADNRIRLGYKWVFGAFNIEDDTAANHSGRVTSPDPGEDGSGDDNSGLDFGELEPSGPLVPGAVVVPVDPWTQRRRYRHLLPQHWKSNLWTYTDEPLTTKQILNHCFNNAWGGFSFQRNYHAALNSIILTGLDYTSGVRLSNLIADINSRCGLDVKIEGVNKLVWGRRGFGLVPVKDNRSAPFSTGEALSTNDTGIRVVGERTRIQRLNIVLEPDWQPGWQLWIDEAAWRREVAATFSLPAVTKADEAYLSAYARHVTVYQFAKAKDDTTLLDARRFGKVSRNDIPAWVYLNELVYRSYRIPSSFALGGVPLSSLEIADSLLMATDVVGEGLAAGQCYADSPAQYYPSSQASAIVRGQSLDLINARDIRLFYRNSTGDLRNEFTVANDFEVDAVNKSIRFATPTFVDGDPGLGESIYIKTNKGESGGEDLTGLVEGQSDYLDIVVPNPGFVITPATVKASFCFMLGRFYKDYGRGPRRGVVNSNGLDLHVLDMTDAPAFAADGIGVIDAGLVRLPEAEGASFSELLYQNGEGAYEKAAELADSLIARSSIDVSGGFTRNGILGTPLSETVERITINVNISSGVTEQVDYAKSPRTTAVFNERTLQRIQRTEEHYSGQDALKREVREYRMLAALERRGDASRDSTHKKMADVFSNPVGGSSPRVHMVRDKLLAAAPAGGWKAGHLVWLDFAGNPAKTGDLTFGGVLVAAPPAAGEDSDPLDRLAIAYSGRVPVRVAPGIQPDSTVAADPGGAIGMPSGLRGIGKLAHGEATPAAVSGELLAMVDLGSIEINSPPPLHIVSSPPSYIPVPASPPAGGAKRCCITWGTLNDQLASNWDAYYDIAVTTYFFAKATLRTTDTLLVSSWEIVTGAASDTHKTTDWLVGADRPGFAVCLLGAVVVDGGSHAIANSGGGSLVLTEHLQNVTKGSGPGDVRLSRQLVHTRLGY